MNFLLPVLEINRAKINSRIIWILIPSKMSLSSCWSSTRILRGSSRSLPYLNESRSKWKARISRIFQISRIHRISRILMLSRIIDSEARISPISRIWNLSKWMKFKIRSNINQIMMVNDNKKAIIQDFKNYCKIKTKLSLNNWEPLCKNNYKLCKDLIKVNKIKRQKSKISNKIEITMLWI